MFEQEISAFVGGWDTVIMEHRRINFYWKLGSEDVLRVSCLLDLMEHVACG